MSGFVTNILDKIEIVGDYVYVETTLETYKYDMRQLHGVTRFPKRHKHKRVGCKLYTAVPAMAEPVQYLIKVTLISNNV